jgi:UDP-N-acetyl-D-glucosamine dehydrogenase
LLKDLIVDKGMRIGIIGLGYIGLPLAIKFSEKGFRVTGVDVNADVINQLLSGESTVEGLSNDRIKTAIETNKRLELVVANEELEKTGQAAIEKLLGIEVFIVCVPTPLKAGNGWAPDLEYIRKSEKFIRRVCETEASLGRLPEERLIVLESTTYPGTTREIFAPLLNDFRDSVLRWYLAYAPERTSPGPRAYNETAPVIPGRERSAFQITRVVGGLDSHSTEIAAELYLKNICEDVHPVSGLETAEMVKLIENTFRFVSIGFSNELSRIAKTFGLNVWELIEAVKTKGFGLDICFPGLIGGHCLPIDAHYLGWALRRTRQIANFVDVAEKAHQDMRQDALDLIQRLLNRNDRGFAGSKVLFFGISYKKNVGDIRESAAVDLIRKLYFTNARVAFWDPVRAKHLFRPRPRIKFSENECRLLSENALAAMSRDADGQRYFEPEELTGSWEELRADVLDSDFDCIVLATDHDDFRDSYREIIQTEGAPPLADLSNCIPAWLATLPTGEDAEMLRRRLDQHKRYMLLGVD